MGVCHLQVMFNGDSSRVTQPLTDHMNRESICQVGLSTRSQVVEEPRTKWNNGLLNQAQQGLPEIQIAPETLLGRLNRSA